MAIKGNYEFKGIIVNDSYIKILNINIYDKIENDKKVFNAKVMYEIKLNKESDFIFNSIFEVIVNPDLPIYGQAYNELKKIINGSIDI